MPTLTESHRTLLERWRVIMNLVGPGPIGEHFDDCNLGLAGLLPTGRWADLGSGAGFPGLVLAAAHPELQVDLIDSRRKRCTFLERVVLDAAQGHRIRVLCERVEDVPGALYDGVTARAFTPTPEALEHAARLLRPGGLALLFLQLDQGVSGGWETLRETRYRLPDGRERRTLLMRQA